MEGTGNGFAAAQPANDPNQSTGQAGVPLGQASEQVQSGYPASGPPFAAPGVSQAAGTGAPPPAGQRPSRAAAQEGEENEETDSDVEAPAPLPPPVVQQSSAPVAPPPPAAKSGAGPRRGGRGGIISLRHLIEDNVIEPGEDVLTVEYKGSTHVATLLPDGRIRCSVNGKDLTFESPSAFSIYLKRLVNPTRKADDGWKTVKYRGKLLEHYKAELARKKLGLGDDEDSAALAPLEPRAAKRARTDAVKPEKFKFGVGTAALTSAAVPDRPRRQRKAPPRFAAIGVDDEHALQPLEAYAPGEQPFTVRVSPAAEVMMDYHAHLCMNEVIGILAGTWDAEARRLDVLRAYPVRELTTEDDSINVEMDPEDQVEKREEAENAGLKIIGWYHSHPTFKAIPSTIDIYNQVLQQHAHREDSHGTVPQSEPYIAAIVSPYDRSGTSPVVSTINWFYVSHAPGAVPAEGQRPDEVGCVGKELAVEAVWEPLGQLENLQTFQREMEHLSKRYAQLPERANLEAPWVDGSLRAEKLVNSLLSRLRSTPLEDAKLSKFAEKVLFSTRAVWNIYGKPVILGPGVAAVAAATTAGGPPPSSLYGTITGSAPASTAVSQEGGVGGGDTDMAAVSEPQGGAGHDADEPISEDDETEDEA